MVMNIYSHALIIADLKSFNCAVDIATYSDSMTSL